MSRMSYWDLLTQQEKMHIELLEKKIENAKTIEEIERNKVLIGMIMAQMVKRARKNRRGISHAKPQNTTEKKRMVHS